MSAPLLVAALAYVAAGVPVLPLVPGEKRPACTRGVLAATTDPAQVRAWWGRRPSCGIGLRTGVAFDAWDVDPGGDEAWARLVESGAVPMVLGEVATPRGRHVYVPVSGGGNRRGAGVDYRGVDGYVVAPPTPGYRWTSDPALLLGA